MEKIKLSNYYMLSDLVKSETAGRLRLTEQFSPPVAVINRLSFLCLNILDPAKEIYPDLKINSGYRCGRLNDHVGGVPYSQHINGEAVDIWCGNLLSLYAWLKMRPFDQLILHNKYIHVSFVSTGNRNMILDKSTRLKK
jgi:hypothetical protein